MKFGQFCSNWSKQNPKAGKDSSKHVFFHISRINSRQRCQSSCTEHLPSLPPVSFTYYPKQRIKIYHKPSMIHAASDPYKHGMRKKSLHIQSQLAKSTKQHKNNAQKPIFFYPPNIVFLIFECKMVFIQINDTFPSGHSLLS